MLTYTEFHRPNGIVSNKWLHESSRVNDAFNAKNAARRNQASGRFFAATSEPQKRQIPLNYCLKRWAVYSLQFVTPSVTPEQIADFLSFSNLLKLLAHP